MKSRKKNSKKIQRINLSKEISLKKLILAVLIVVLFVEVGTTYSMSSALSENTRSSNLNFISITDSSCNDCGSLDPFIQAIESLNVKISSNKSLDLSSQEAKQILNENNIKRVPVLIVSGEVTREKSLMDLFSQIGIHLKDSVYIISEPPYVNLTTNEVKGRVSVINIVDSSCALCSKSLNNFVSSLKRGGIAISAEKNLEYTSSEAKSLIEKFGLQKIPVTVFSNDLKEYRSIQSIWTQLDAIEKSDSFAVQSIPPYRNLSTEKVDGLVTLYSLVDGSCSSCYDVSLHKQILASNFGITPSSDTSVDISSQAGKDLISKYNITKVPTIVFSPEASLYTSLADMWSSVGKVASDGWFVFTSVEQMGTYKDLTTGQIVS